MPRIQSEITELISQRPGRAAIHKAVKHENRLRLHTEVALERSDVAGANDFLLWVESLIPDHKYRMFLNLFQLPAYTGELVGEIYNQLYRVFSGRNQAVSYQFTDNRLNDDWEWYRQEVLQEPELWDTKAWEIMQMAINSIMVVDLPQEQSGPLPSPYLYFVGVENIVGYQMKNEKEFDWVAFKQPDDRIAFFDSDQRVVFIDQDGKLTLEAQQPHDLGFCPARFFWTDTIKMDKASIKRSPISRQLSKLDWVLFFEISKHHLDLYAAYPIYSAYAQECEYSNPETGEYCDGGFLKGPSGFLFAGSRVMRCPVCEKNSLAGVGSFIEVPPPTGGQEGVDMRKPVDITTIDKDSLQYNVEEVGRLKTEIFNNSVGRGAELAREAINEMQVMSGFETKTSILLNLKKNLEAARLWVTEAVCKTRYGGAFLSASINLGTEFYVYTIKDLYDKYDQAKKSGASDIVLDNILDKIIELEHINNPVEMQRVYVLKHLEPYRHLTKDEVVKLYQSGIIRDYDQVYLKLNFSSLIQRFERENTNIIEFGVEQEFDAKVNTIKQTLLSYGEKDTAGQGAAGSGGANPARGAGQPAGGGANPTPTQAEPATA